MAAGLGRRWDVDPILIRGGFVALTVFGGIGLVFYGLAWLFLPHEDGRIHLQQAMRGDFSPGFVGALLLSLTALGGGGSWDNGFGWAFPGGLIITAAVIFGIWWMAKQHSDDSGSQAGKTAPAPTYPPAGPVPSAWPDTDAQGSEAARQARRTAKAQAIAEAQDRTRAAKARRARTAPSRMIVRLSLGVALLLAAAILVIGNASDWSEPVGLIATASALAVIAAGVIASGLSGRRAPGLATVGVILAIAALVGAAAENAGVRSGQHVTVVGKQTWEPHTVDAAEGQYNLGVGEATLDLTDPAILRTATLADPLQVRIRVGAGHLTVIVPDEVTTRIDLEVGAGNVSYPDGSSYRFDSDVNTTEQQRLTTGPNGQPRMIVDVQQGAGQLDIRTASGLSITNIPNPTATNSSAPNPTAPSPSPASSAVPSVRATPTATVTN